MMNQSTLGYANQLINSLSHNPNVYCKIDNEHGITLVLPTQHLSRKLCYYINRSHELVRDTLSAHNNLIDRLYLNPTSGMFESRKLLAHTSDIKDVDKLDQETTSHDPYIEGIIEVTKKQWAEL